MNESFMGSESELTSSSESKFKLYALSEVIEKCLTFEGHIRKQDLWVGKSTAGSSKMF